MTKGSEVIGVRGSTWSRDFIVGAGAPGGVRLPWAKPVKDWKLMNATEASKTHGMLARKGRTMFIKNPSDLGAAVGRYWQGSAAHSIRSFPSHVSQLVEYQKFNIYNSEICPRLQRRMRATSMIGIPSESRNSL